ncbi:MAG: sugar-binding protein [Paludibacteraceae bacterium]
MQIKQFSLTLMLIAPLICFSQRITPYQGSRIFWDFDSQTTVFTSGNYSRMIELQDGRLIAVAEALGGISITYSSNRGSTWSSPQLIASPPDNVFYAVPDVIQLKDGTILVGINPRPKSPYSAERLFGIRVVRSTDNGSTWSTPIFVFDAHHTFENGCWEPSFLELPSGEVQCYFANEGPYTYNSDQQISVSRSFDKGVTWNAPAIVSYRSGNRDGMPAPILLQDSSEIVVIIEDNGWSGRGNFAATTVRNTLKDNWTKGYVNASSTNRQMIFETIPSTSIYSAAPYIRKLPWGETVASFQSNENRASSNFQYADMHVLVGDERARNFKAKTTPFALQNDKHAIWNSVSVIDTGVVVALGSIGVPNGINDIVMIKGYPIRQAKANQGSITVDGERQSSEKWTTPSSAQLFLGATTGNKTKVDFLYDTNYLYLTSLVVDRTIINTGTDNDGIRFNIDVDDISSSSPQNGVYSFFFDTNGTVKFKRGNNGTWITDNNTEGILYAVNVKSIYYNIEVAIPWSLLGKSTPPIDNRMAITIENVDKQQYTLKTTQIADVDNDASWTWLEFNLAPSQNTDNKNTTCHNLNTVKSYISEGILHIESPSVIKELSLFSLMGQLIEKRKCNGQNLQIPFPSFRGGILRLIFDDNTVHYQKFLISSV